MEKKNYLRVALPTPMRRLFDYLPPQALDSKALILGARVRVPFHHREIVGILFEVVNESSVPAEKLKTALEVIDKESVFSTDVYELCSWAAGYYHYSLGEVLMSALPGLLRKGKENAPSLQVLGGTPVGLAGLPSNACKDTDRVLQDLSKAIKLNSDQQLAINTINAAYDQFQVFLLDGVTGSGKTEVYLQCIESTIRRNQQVLVLIPEISLTPQTIERFRNRFKVSIVALHSSLSEKERLLAWQLARTNEARIVIGTRSAVFTSLANPGLIIVDEEHDTSFKQQERFRYHARDLAIKRASLNQIPIVLGSATPSLESLLNVKRKRYVYLSLPMRAGKAQLPNYQLIDLRYDKPNEGFSNALLTAMQEHLDKENQVLLFLNRRGFAPVLYCLQCHWIAECTRCDARLVYHRRPPRLHCHYCDQQSEIPLYCANCKKTSLEPIGLGTQRIEQTLEKHFPGTPILRIDRDSTRRKGAMQTFIDDINSHKKAILLGTQMLAKGHHFPRVTLVGIMDADSGLFSADFRVVEQMGQLLVQVAGRAGREEKLGSVLMQTRNPEHPLLQMLIHQGYSPFAQALLKEREQAALPPFSYFAVIRAEAYKEKTLNHFLMTVKNNCNSFADQINVLGPLTALMAKRKGLHCQHLVIKAQKRPVLQTFLQTLLQKIEKLTVSQTVKWVLDVDPIDI